MTRSLIRLSGVEYEHSVGKRLELLPNGSLLRTPLLEERARPGQMINRSFDSAVDTFEYRLEATAKQMFVTGTFRPDLTEARVLPKAAVARARMEFGTDSGPVLVALTKEYLAYRAGPGLISIDVDYKGADEVAGLWPQSSPGALSSPTAVLQALYDILPEAAGHPIMVMPSSSSMIESNSGQLLRGPGGWRLLLVTADASQTARILEMVHIRCWARQMHSYAFVSKGGQILLRSIADQALARPTQPDYPVAELGPGLRRSPDQTIIDSPDGEFFDPSSVGVTSAERSLAVQAASEAKTALQAKAAALTSIRESTAVSEMLGRGVAEPAARHAVRSRHRGLLLGQDSLIFETGSVSVAALISDGEAFDGKSCQDPVEPDYDGGRAVAIFYWNDGRGPRIHSFAHGPKTYRLAYDFESAKRAIDEGKVSSTAISLVLAQAAVDEIENAQLESDAAKKLGLGNQRQVLRDTVARSRRECALSAPMERSSPDFGFPVSETPSEPLRSTVPVVNSKGLPLDHMDNVLYLLNGYGVDYHYDEILKDFEWQHGTYTQMGDNSGEMLHSFLVGLCSLNDVPKKNLGTHITALGSLKTHNPVVAYLKSLVWDKAPRFDRFADAMGGDDPDIARIAIPPLKASSFLSENKGLVRPRAFANCCPLRCVAFQGRRRLGFEK